MEAPPLLSLAEAAAEAGLTLPREWEAIDPELQQRIDARVGKLHALPLGTLRIVSAIEEPGASVARVAQLVARDPAVAAEIFRVVNSAAFGLMQPVGDVHRAVVVLGYTSVRSIAMRLGIARSIGSDARAADELKALWVHSHLTCEALQAIRAHVGGDEANAYFTAALMHDLGKLLRVDLAAGSDCDFEDATLSAEERALAEERELGVSHAVLGARISLRLRLPKLVREVQRYHHHPLELLARTRPLDEGLRAIAAVRLASELARHFVRERALEAAAPVPTIGADVDPSKTRVFTVPDVTAYRAIFARLPDWVALAATVEPALERALAVVEAR